MLRSDVNGKNVACNKNKMLEYQYEKNPKQLHGLECGDLCSAKEIEILSGNNPSNITFAIPSLLCLHTSTTLLTQRATPYPKSSVNSDHYTSVKNISVPLLSCLPMQKKL